MDAVAGRPLDPGLLRELDGLANRGYTGGFYERHPDREYQSYLKSHSESDRSLYVGDVIAYDAAGLAEIDVKNRFSVGDRIELIHPSGNLELTITTMQGQGGSPVSVAPGSGHRVSLTLPAGYEGAFVARFVAERDPTHA
jgi:putative protease